MPCRLAHSKTYEGRSWRGRPAATKDCINCHMPKIEIPKMHTAFADYLIRVVRTGAPIPD